MSLGKGGDFYIDLKDKVLYRKSTGNLIAWMDVAKLANTIQFKKENFDLKYESQLSINLPWTVFEESMVSIYAKPSQSAYWYPIPGFFIDKDDQFRVHFRPDGDNTHIFFSRNDIGGNDYSNTTIRIVVTEADIFETVSKTIDFKNYDEVSRYFKLGE
ncbi:MAG TPA: hypothetical protein VK102_05095 [Sphingobacterium sp.]|nr:hypothetical protein [Sphingobacterium sp.]